MKKPLLYSLLCILAPSLCVGQDTLVYRTGQKAGVKIYSVEGDIVIYTLPPDEKQLSVGTSQLDYIKYKDGSRYTIQHEEANQNNSEDTVAKLNSKKLRFYFSIGGGRSSPQGLYGSDSYHIDLYGTYNQYTGFASQGYILNTMAGVIIGRHGWELTLKGDYIQQGFDALGFFNENIEWYYLNHHDQLFNSSTNFTNYSSVTSTETYKYTHWILLIGVTKNFTYKKVNCGLRFLLGDMMFNFPEIHGTVSFTKQDSINSIPYSKTYLWEINRTQYSLPAIDFGFKLELKITSHLRGILNLDYIFSSVQFDMVSSIRDINNIVISNPTISTSTNISMINSSLGLEYSIGK